MSPTSDDTGREVDVPARVGRVVSIVPSLTEAVAATAPGRFRDLAVRVFTLIGQGMPQFWVGIMLILLLAVKAGAFPVGGYGTTPAEHPYYLFLPALTLAQQWDLTADEVARNVFAHPTLSEAMKEAIEGIAGHMINL